MTPDRRAEVQTNQEARRSDGCEQAGANGGSTATLRRVQTRRAAQPEKGRHRDRCRAGAWTGAKQRSRKRRGGGAEGRQAMQ